MEIFFQKSVTVQQRKESIEKKKLKMNWNRREETIKQEIENKNIVTRVSRKVLKPIFK